MTGESVNRPVRRSGSSRSPCPTRDPGAHKAGTRSGPMTRDCLSLARDQLRGLATTTTTTAGETTTTAGRTIAGFAGLTGLLEAGDVSATSPFSWEQPLGTLPKHPERLFPFRCRGTKSLFRQSCNPANPAIVLPAVAFPPFGFSDGEPYWSRSSLTLLRAGPSG